MSFAKPPVSGTSVDGEALLLRAMQLDDLDTVYNIECRAHSHPWKRATLDTRMKNKDLCRVLELNQKLVAYAFVSYGGGDAELLNITVDPDYQCRGLASSLLPHMISLAAEFADLLFLEVRVSNQRAIDLYSRAGFFETGHRPNYYPAARGREDALLMTYQLRI